jgi:large subunit ribosomal protein L9
MELIMKVILQKDVPNLGESGDIKDVSSGFARNYLLPKKLVLLANEKSKKAIDHQKKLIKIKKDKRKKSSEKLAELMSGLEIKIIAQVGEEGKLFGSVTSMDIMKKMKEAGFEIDKRKIHLTAPIKQAGTFDVQIKLDEGLTANVKVTVDKE